MPDTTYKCKDCQSDFVFTEGEQSYYRDRGLAIPKRCGKCRLKRRQGRQSSEVPTPTEKKEQPNQ